MRRAHSGLACESWIACLYEPSARPRWKVLCLAYLPSPFSIKENFPLIFCSYATLRKTYKLWFSGRWWIDLDRNSDYCGAEFIFALEGRRKISSKIWLIFPSFRKAVHANSRKLQIIMKL